ncbi:MAG: hypothetical protein ACMUJM_02875 [bacterium]
MRGFLIIRNKKIGILLIIILALSCLYILKFTFGISLSGLVTFLFFSVFVFIVWCATYDAQRLKREIREERIVSARFFSTGSIIEEFIQQIRTDRNLTISRKELSRTPPSINYHFTFQKLLERMHETPQPLGCITHISNFQALLDTIAQLYIAGDTLGLQIIEETLQKCNELRLKPFDKYELAFVVGFLGTIIGIALQFLTGHKISMETIFHPSFLHGALVALITTLLGILTVLYTAFLKERCTNKLDDLNRHLIEGSMGLILPALGCNEQDRRAFDLAGVIGDRLKTEFNNFSQSFVETISKSIRKGIENSLNDRIEGKIEEVKKSISTSLEKAGSAIDHACDAIKEGVGALERQIQSAINQPGHLTSQLRSAISEIANIENNFEKINTRLRDTGKVVGEIMDQLEYKAESMEIKAAQSEGGVNEESLGIIFQESQRLTDKLSTMLAHLTNFTGHLTRVDDAIKDQEHLLDNNNKIILHIEDKLNACSHTAECLNKRMESQAHYSDLLLKKEEVIEDGARPEQSYGLYHKIKSFMLNIFKREMSYETHEQDEKA